MRAVPDLRVSLQGVTPGGHSKGYSAPVPLFSGFAEGLRRQVQIGQIVCVAEERLLATVATLGDVVWRAWDHHSCLSGHSLSRVNEQA